MTLQSVVCTGHYSKESQNFELVFRMSRNTFEYICALISDDFSRKTQSFRNFRFGDKIVLGLEDQVVIALLRLASHF
jgi:hypothetical protein